jgi:hypothetical protein
LRSSSPSRRGGGIRRTIVGGLTALVKGKTVETALVGGLSIAPDALLALGEIQRIRFEGRSPWDALVNFARLELFQYTGILYQPTAVSNGLREVFGMNSFRSLAQSGDWSWEPLTRFNYDIPNIGRSPLKIGPIDNYGMKMLPRIILRFARKVPVVGKVLRQLLNAPNPLRRLG